VRFEYEPYPHYAALFGFGFVVVVVVSALGRRWARRPLAPIDVPPTYPERSSAEEDAEGALAAEDAQTSSR
jgi:hypothetical protein